MSATDQPSEEELRAAYEAELKQVRVEQIVLEQIVTLINLGMRRTGMQPGTEDERDPEQVRVAIDGVRLLMPLVESGIEEGQAAAIREALSQLQLVYVRLGGGAGAAVSADGAPPHRPAPGAPAGPAGPAAPGPPPPPPGPAGAPDPADGPGPAQRSGRLWTPGQR